MDKSWYFNFATYLTIFLYFAYIIVCPTSFSIACHRKFRASWFFLNLIEGFYHSENPFIWSHIHTLIRKRSPRVVLPSVKRHSHWTIELRLIICDNMNTIFYLNINIIYKKVELNLENNQTWKLPHDIWTSICIILAIFPQYSWLLG